MSVTFVDTHCHLNLAAFESDVTEVVERAEAAGVNQIIVPAIDLDSIPSVIALAERFTQVFAAIGIHPNDVPLDRSPDSVAGVLLDAANHHKVVAIGEIGLDYHWDKTPARIQHEWLHMQLEVAAQLELPVILHNRDATKDMLPLLNEWLQGRLPRNLKDRPGVLHSFSADWMAAEYGLSLGFYLGIAGPITYRNAEIMREVAARVPFERVLIETDAPFLSPQPHRGKRNEPAFVVQTAEKLAELRSLDMDSIGRKTTQNAQRLFKMPMVLSND